MIGAYLLTLLTFLVLLAWGWQRGRCRCLTKCTVLTVKPDDVLVLTVDDELSPDEAEYLARCWREATGVPNRPVVLTGGVSVSAMRAAGGERSVNPFRVDL